MAHKFALNQRVRIVSGASLALVSPDGVYTIVKLLPQGQDGQYSYRLKSQAGERVTVEGALIIIAGLNAGTDSSISRPLADTCNSS